MNNKIEKRLLEVYGLFRMTLGIAQLVGLCFSYFLLEFIIKYPKSQLIQVFDQDVIAIIFLAVIFRGLFHLIVGVGIVRLREWSKIWIYWGWFFILIINAGVFYVHFNDFYSNGNVSNVFEMINWGNLFIYSLLVILDYTLISSRISLIDNESALEGIGGRIESGKVFFFFMAVLVFFCLIMFLGRPIKKGFSRGFYKSRGKISKTATKKRVLAPSRKSDKIKEQIEEKNKIILIEAKTKELRIDEQQLDGKLKLVEGKKKEMVKRDMPYKGIIGLCSVLSIIFGFVLQLFSVTEFSSRNDGLLFSYCFIALGFLLGSVYLIHAKLMPLFFASLICFLICASIVGRLAAER